MASLDIAGVSSVERGAVMFGRIIKGDVDQIVEDAGRGAGFKDDGGGEDVPDAGGDGEDEEGLLVRAEGWVELKVDRLKGLDFISGLTPGLSLSLWQQNEAPRDVCLVFQACATW